MAKKPDKKVELVHKALERCNGHFFKASLCVNMEEDEFRKFVFDHESLRNRWMDSKDGHTTEPLDGAEVLSRNPLPGETPPTDDQVAVALLEEDKKLQREGLMGFGLNDAELDIALSLQQYGHERFQEGIEIINASIVPTRIKLLSQQTIIQDRLAFVRKQIEDFGELLNESREKWVAEENLLMKQYVEVVHLAATITDQTNRGAVTMAMMKIKFASRNGSKEKQAKPGFTKAIPV